MRRQLVAVFLATLVNAQVPESSDGDAATPAALVAAEAKARADLADAAKLLDDLLLRAGELQASAKAALDLVRSSEAGAKQADRSRLATLAADIATQLDVLSRAIAFHTDELRKLRESVAAEAPPAPGSAAFHRRRIDGAMNQRSLEDVEVALAAIEKDLQAGDAKDAPGNAQLLAVVRYRIASTIVERARLLTGTTRDDRRAEAMHKEARAKFEQVHESPDSHEEDIGTSLRAAALLRVLEIDALLAIAYAQLAEREPSARSHQVRANEFKRSARKLLEEIERRYGDAKLPGGRRVVDAATENYRSIKR